MPVVGLVGEAVRAVEVRGRRVGERAVSVERQRAVGRTGDQDGGQRVAVGIRVVGQHPGAGTVSALSSSVTCKRRSLPPAVVDAVHRDRDGRHVGVRPARRWPCR